MDVARSQEESSHQERTLLSSWTFSLENCNKIHLCYLSAQSVIFCHSSPNKLIQEGRQLISHQANISAALNHPGPNVRQL